MYIDTHAHFDVICRQNSSAEEAVLSSMAARNVSQAVQISVKNENFEWCRNFALRNRTRGIFFTIGIHPSSALGEERLKAMASYIEKLDVKQDMEIMFGVGECGLDYYHMKSPREEQIKAFEYQIGLAKKINKPVIVHTRDAWNDTVEVLKRTRPECGIIHCFSGDAAAAAQALDMGFYISFAGNVTYKKAVNLHESARFVPLDRLLIETDAPFLTPDPMRGKANIPEYIKYSYDCIAELKGKKTSVIEESVSSNFEKITASNRS
ncbi:MAG: TatD family hydrolase [Leptospirales bacterium]|nr:TatD family hydrolase [Leptospirales bacterium]